MKHLCKHEIGLYISIFAGDSGGRIDAAASDRRRRSAQGG